MIFFDDGCQSNSAAIGDSEKSRNKKQEQKATAANSLAEILDPFVLRSAKLDLQFTAGQQTFRSRRLAATHRGALCNVTDVKEWEAFFVIVNFFPSYICIPQSDRCIFLVSESIASFLGQPPEVRLTLEDCF